MKLRVFISSAIATMVILSTPAFAAEGTINVKSAHDVATTADRLESILKEKGMTVFARIKHSDGAKKVGVELRDTQLVIFGNPKVGSPIMKCAQSAAIDLPQKALIWLAEDGTVTLSYNDPMYLQKRHDIQGCDAVLGKVNKALAGISKAATSK